MRVINIDTDFGVFCVDSNRGSGAQGRMERVGRSLRVWPFVLLAVYVVRADIVVVVVVRLGFRVKPNRVTTARVFLHNIM